MIAGKAADEVEEEQNDDPNGDENEINAVEVSLCSVVGLTSPKTMKLGRLSGARCW